jgi:hypothetical protein
MMGDLANLDDEVGIAHVPPSNDLFSVPASLLDFTVNSEVFC